jgi:hypothetical protein
MADDDDLLDAFRSLGKPAGGPTAEVSIDLNLDANLKELEDQDLVAHMDEARRLLREIEEKSGQLPDEAKLKTSHAGSQQILSATIVEFGKIMNEFQTAVELSYVQAGNAEKLAAGVRPHGFPEVKSGVPTNAGSLTTMSGKITEASKTFENIRAALLEVGKKLHVFRRDTNGVADGYARLADYRGKCYDELLARHGKH